MCLILFAYRVRADAPLIVAANRDEFHGRPAALAQRWTDAPTVLAGRDLTAGGTWLGVSASGRFAAVTNFSETPEGPLPPGTRGDLTANFLRTDTGARVRTPTRSTTIVTAVSACCCGTAATSSTRRIATRMRTRAATRRPRSREYAPRRHDVAKSHHRQADAE